MELEDKRFEAEYWQQILKDLQKVLDSVDAMNKNASTLIGSGALLIPASIGNLAVMKAAEEILDTVEKLQEECVKCLETVTEMGTLIQGRITALKSEE